MHSASNMKNTQTFGNLGCRSLHLVPCKAQACCCNRARCDHCMGDVASMHAMQSMLLPLTVMLAASHRPRQQFNEGILCTQLTSRQRCIAATAVTAYQAMITSHYNSPNLLLMYAHIHLPPHSKGRTPFGSLFMCANQIVR